MENFLNEEAISAVTDEMLAAMTHDPAQELQWALDAAIQRLNALKQRVHDAREREDLKNRPPASQLGAQQIGFGKPPLQIGEGKGE